MPLKYFAMIFFTFACFKVKGQENPDHIFDSTIHTISIAPMGNPLAAPIISLKNGSVLRIGFDDFKAQYEDYYYAIELMDSAWHKINYNEFDYMRGFNLNKITNYSISSMTSQNYFHYQFDFPNSNCKPIISGNYILKIFKGSNKELLVFTKRFYVVDDIASVSASIQEPFDGRISRTHQKVNVNVDVTNIPSFQNDLITVKVVQNNRFNDAKITTKPDFIRGSTLVFNNEATLIFPGGKEARWLDLQSLSLRSDRISQIENNNKIKNIFVKPDISRSDLMYSSYKDLNGGYLIINTESLQNETQNDYAKVHFYYVTKNNSPLLDKHLFLSGAITNNSLDKQSEMEFDVKKGAYQKTLLLKQGYYSYNYILRDRNEPNDLEDYAETEGDHAETENEYIVFVYYHMPGSLHDQLIGFTTLNSKQF